MPKQYFFQVGSFKDISHVELLRVFEMYGISRDVLHSFNEEIFLIKSSTITEDILLKIFNRLGGSIRLGYIIDDLDTFLDIYKERESKVVFGISILDSIRDGDTEFLKKLGNEIKKGLKEYGISGRFISPMRRDISLNAAQILKNDILSKGFELCILRNKEEEVYACTLAIQDLKGYVERDLDRPYANFDMGVLPPKLARIMINLCGVKEGIIWDPFCGSGTILMESAVLGYNFLGSDIDSNAIFQSDENIKWLSSKGYTGNILYELFRMDVSNPSKDVLKKLRNTNISGIVCEPYMGPPQKRVLNTVRAKALLEDVKHLYKELFNVIDEELGMRDFNMVLIIPSYKTDRGWESFGIRDIISNRWELLNSKYSSGRDLKWSRKNSIITRNVFMLHRT